MTTTFAGGVPKQCAESITEAICSSMKAYISNSFLSTEYEKYSPQKHYHQELVVFKIQKLMLFYFHPRDTKSFAILLLVPLLHILKTLTPTYTSSSYRLLVSMIQLLSYLELKLNNSLKPFWCINLKTQFLNHLHARQLRLTCIIFFFEKTTTLF